MVILCITFSIFKDQNATTNDAVKRTTEAVTKIWLKSGIPMKSSWLHSKQILKIFKSWKKSMIDASSMMEAATEKLWFVEKPSLSATRVRVLNNNIFLESCTDTVWLEARMRLLEHGLNILPLRFRIERRSLANKLG